MRSRALLLALLAGTIGVAGCEGKSDTMAVDPGGGFEFELLGPARMEGASSKVLWRPGPINVALQRAARTRLNHEASLADVAQALQSRYQNGEVDGELQTSACRLAGVPAQCFVGAIRRGGRESIRRGWIVEGADELVLLEVIGDASATEEVNEQVDLIGSTMHWTET